MGLPPVPLRALNNTLEHRHLMESATATETTEARVGRQGRRLGRG